MWLSKAQQWSCVTVQIMWLNSIHIMWLSKLRRWSCVTISRAELGVNLEVSVIRTFIIVSKLKFCVDSESVWCHLRNVEHFSLYADIWHEVFPIKFRTFRGRGKMSIMFSPFSLSITNQSSLNLLNILYRTYINGILNYMSKCLSQGCHWPCKL